MSDALRKLSAAAIADRWGPLKERMAADAAELEALRYEFDRRGLTVAQGVKYAVMKSVKAVKRLSVEAIRGEMGEAWCAAREKDGERTTYVVSAIGGGK